MINFDYQAHWKNYNWFIVAGKGFNWFIIKYSANDARYGTFIGHKVINANLTTQTRIWCEIILDVKKW